MYLQVYAIQQAGAAERKCYVLKVYQCHFLYCPGQRVYMFAEIFSRSAISSCESTREAPPRLSLTWSLSLAPNIAAVTPGRERIHAIATWPGRAPLLSAIVHSSSTTSLTFGQYSFLKNL